jgi:HEAT repeat protein
MRLILYIFLSLPFLFGGFARLQADEEPKAIIKKAITAQGGESLLRQVKAARIKAKGMIPHPQDPENPKVAMPFRGALDFQLPDRFRLEFDAKLPLDSEGVEAKYSVIQVFDQGKYWSKSSLPEEAENDDAERRSLTDWSYVENLRSLFPLLDDKEYSLQFGGESKTKDRTVLKIKVTAKGKPEVRLFFDKALGFLVSAEYRSIVSENLTKKDVTVRHDFDDYREVQSNTADEQLLTDAKVGTAGPALLDFLRKKTIGNEEREKIRSLIRSLGDSSFEVREKAKADLLGKGPAAVPFLARALKNADPEIVSLAKECLEKIGEPKDTAPILAVVRILASRREAGVVEALLAYAPSAPNDAVAEEVASAVAVLGMRDGKPDSQLEKALEDKDPDIRALAAAVVKRDPTKMKNVAGLRLFLPGLKWPMKEVWLHDGKKYYDWEVTEVLFYSNLSDDLFAKP